jgi:hypothetical protein
MAACRHIDSLVDFLDLELELELELELDADWI